MKDLKNLAVAVIIVDNKKVCLVKRGKDPFKGMWVLPGGHVGERETVEDAAIRESKEETGLNIQLLSLFGVSSAPFRHPTKRLVDIVFIARPESGKLKAGTDSVDVWWYPLDKALKMRLGFDHNKYLDLYASRSKIIEKGLSFS